MQFNSDEPPDSLLALSRTAQSDPTKQALSFWDKNQSTSLTYFQFATAIDAFAGTLSGCFDIHVSDAVAVLSANRLWVPVCYFGVWRLGATIVPLNPRADVADWLRIIQHADSRLLIVDRSSISASQLQELITTPRLPVAFGEDIFGDTSPDHPIDAREADTECGGIILYTSGTTSSQKGVKLSRRKLDTNASFMAERLRLHNDIHLAVLPLFHAHALGVGLLTSILSGGSLIFTDGFEVQNWQRIVSSQRVTVTSIVPNLLPLLRLLKIRRQECPALRFILVSSAPLDFESANNFIRVSEIPLIQGWGLTEYTNFAACVPNIPNALLDSADSERRGFSIGCALRDTEIGVFRDSDARAHEGELGELRVRGPCLMEGYFKEKSLTNQAFTDGWLRTGDEGYFLQRDGQIHFYFSGRLKELIVRGGEKFSPLFIEDKLIDALPVLAGVATIFGIPHSQLGEEIACYVQNTGDLDEGSVLSALRGINPAFRPAVVYFGPDEVPKTHTGKVQRRRVVDLLTDRSSYLAGNTTRITV